MKNNGSAKIIVILLALAVVLGVGYVVVVRNSGTPEQKQDSQVASDDRVGVVADETAGWKVYKNGKHGLEFKYPNEIVYPQFGGYPGRTKVLSIKEYEDTKTVSVDGIQLSLRKIDKPVGYSNLESFVKDVVDRENRENSQGAAPSYVGLEKIIIPNSSITGFAAITRAADAPMNTSVGLYIEAPSGLLRVYYSYAAAALDDRANNVENDWSKNELVGYDVMMKILSTLKVL